MTIQRVFGFEKHRGPNRNPKQEKESETVIANKHSIKVVPFRNILRSWGREHFRYFPWRQARNPYKILLAEILLHRTQATQVVPVYGLLIEKYPTLKALISAKKTELYDILRPLGLRWRIEFLHRMVKELEAKFEGKIPRDKNSLLSLSGVSDYIAGAVRCFAWNLPESLIDTNTVRIIGRVFGLKIKDSSRRNAQFKYLSSALLDSDDSRAFNYAMLDLANSICTKTKAPDCKQCPIMNWCAYGSAQKKIM